MRARMIIASLVLSATLAVGALPAAAFADDALGDVDSPQTPTATTKATSSAVDSVSLRRRRTASKCRGRARRP